MVIVVGTEVWKYVVGYEGIYEVSDQGRVRRIASGRILKPGLDTHGYMQVVLCFHGDETKRLMAHLVADAFLPSKSPTDQVVRHLNDDPSDNRACNLARGTYSDNMTDSMRNNRFCVPKGVSHWKAKLTEDDVREIRRLYATGNFSHREIAVRFGVHTETVGHIVRRQRWNHVV